jgi:hypothetical protein
MQYGRITPLLAVGSHRRRQVRRAAPRLDELRNSDEHEDDEQTYVQLTVYQS